jgi:peptide/nickel transport system substrate-binding protein
MALTAVVAALALTACGSKPTSKQEPTEPTKGGTLYVLNSTEATTWDPQRNSEAAVYGFGVRTVWRTWTTAEPGTGELVGDLAQDVGTVSNDGRTWKFEMRDDAFWQDGKPVSCEDVKYGISRTFAINQITGGSTYAIRFLDIPRDDEGKSRYQGPYSNEGQDLFDKAVTCSGTEITFRLANPQFDFNQTLSTSGFVPYRQDQDQGAKSTFSIFSNGPYMLKEDWKSGRGGTFVRNPYWKPAPHDVRLALPDEIVVEEGMAEDVPIQRIIADSGKDSAAITQVPATPAQQPLIMGNPTLKERTVFVERTGVDFLQPNFRSRVMGNEKVREALALATDRRGYSQALGGEELFPPTFSVLHHSLEGWSEESPFGAPLEGDPAKAKALLESSGLTLPVAVNVAYRKSSTSDKAMAALAEGWKAGGFSVKLSGIADNYYGVAATPASKDKYDVFWNTWGQAWPSAATIVPNLFDSRINLSDSGSRLDYGYFDDKAMNTRMDETGLVVGDSEREKAWGQISLDIAKEGGYIALTEQRALLPIGSSVDLGKGTKGVRGQVDLAEISVGK